MTDDGEARRRTLDDLCVPAERRRSARGPVRSPGAGTSRIEHQRQPVADQHQHVQQVEPEGQGRDRPDDRQPPERQGTTRSVSPGTARSPAGTRRVSTRSRNEPTTSARRTDPAGPRPPGKPGRAPRTPAPRRRGTRARRRASVDHPRPRTTAPTTGAAVNSGEDQHRGDQRRRASRPDPATPPRQRVLSQRGTAAGTPCAGPRRRGWRETATTGGLHHDRAKRPVPVSMRSACGVPCPPGNARRSRPPSPAVTSCRDPR